MSPKPNAALRFDRRTPVVVLLGALIVVGLYFAVVRPMSARLASATAETAETTAAIAKSSKELAEAKKTGQGSLEALYATAREADTALPQKVDSPELASVLASSASSSGLKIANLAPDASPTPGTTPGLSYLGFSTTVTGAYGGISGWLQLLQGRTDQVITVDSATLTVQGGGEYSAAVELRVWFSEKPTLTKEAAGTDPAAPAPTDPAAPAPAPAAPAPSTPGR